MVIVLPDDSPDEDAASARAAAAHHAVLRRASWEQVRSTALEAALAVEGEAIHAVDMDRLLHWIETYPDELRETVREIAEVDCLITGRTARAFGTHPLVMQQTEDLSNLLACSLLRTTGLDVCAGSRGLSREVAGLVLRYRAERVWGDVAWPVLASRAGHRVRYRATEGLEWETPDHFRDTVADEGTRRVLAAAVDADPQEWARRVDIAGQILAEGLAASQAPLDV